MYRQQQWRLRNRGALPTTFLLLFLFMWQSPFISAGDIQKDIIGTAQNCIGNNYCRGGALPPCFDCSGFISYVLKSHVSDLPRVSREMARYGKGIGKDNLQPGDLVFFATTSRSSVVSHVALYIGQDSIIHAISNGPNRGVNVTSLSSRYWKQHYHSASRVLPDSAFSQSQEAEHTQEPIRFAKGSYTGELENGEPEGEGTLRLDNGDLYRGEFLSGLFHGKGTYTWKSGAIYKGKFSSGKFDGQGVYISEDGNRTEGVWENGTLKKESDKMADTGSQKPDSSKPAEQKPSTPKPDKTYLEEEDSPWDTWDGYITGDYYSWREKEKETFENWKNKNQPQ